jgi:predicted nucleotidyltransferase
MPLKKYFYCLRPALALCWLRTHADGLAPMDLPSLLAAVELPDPLRAAIDVLLAAKAASKEMGDGDRIGIIDAFMELEFASARARRPAAPAIEPSLVDQAQLLFLRMVMASGDARIQPAH